MGGKATALAIQGGQVFRLAVKSQWPGLIRLFSRQIMEELPSRQREQWMQRDGIFSIVWAAERSGYGVKEAAGPQA